MQTYRALAEVAGIVDAVNRLQRIDGTGLGWIHFDGVGGFEVAGAGIQILRDDTKVLDPKPSHWNRHPAVLLAVVVHGTGLSHFPTDGNQFIEGRLVDQIAGVVLLVPGEIGGQSVGHNRGILQEADNLVDAIEGGLGKLSQFSDEILDWNRL